MTNLLTMKKWKREGLRDSSQISCRIVSAKREVYTDEFSELF